MKNKKILIIGSGIAGLCAGSYLQMNGYDTEIFEMHDIPGGLCTSWVRKDYTFDGCIYSIGILNKKQKISRWWRELIDVDNLKFYCHDNLGTYEDESGNVINFSSDLVKLERDLKAIAPEDTKFIDSFIKTIKWLAKFDLHPSKPLELWNPIDY
jgi:phytoene dehydrogenase-like protein